MGQLVAQNNLPTVKTPVSPVAASFNVYGEIPVSKYPGIPDISIPLYTIYLGSLQIPISLSYHPAGVRVEAEASWVGLGWTLMAGGTISREVRGIDDLNVNGYWNRYRVASSEDYRKPVPYSVLDCYNESGDCSEYFDYDRRSDIDCTGKLDYVAKRRLRIDCDPDLFSYNFMGYNGRFVMKENANSAILEKPEDNLNIYFEDSNNGVDINIIVVLPTGDKFYFTQTEKSASYSGTTHIYDAGERAGESCIVTWYLTDIELANGNYVSFEYVVKKNIERNVYRTQTLYTDQLSNMPLYSPSVNKSLSQSEIPSSKCGGLYALPELSPFNNVIDVHGSFAYTEPYLKSISWNGNKINFTHAPRTDYGLPYVAKDKPVCLTNIEIRNNRNKQVKKYDFYYSYSARRLQLDSLSETYEKASLPPYRFYYDNRYTLPLQTSLCFDVWGYYNGSSSPFPNQNLYPEIVFDGQFRYFDWEYPPRGGRIAVSGRNFRCNPEYLTTGMLNKMVYPTGGYAEFTFEPNTYMSYLQMGLEKKGGGVRIAKIKTDAQERIFSYNDGEKSSGVLLVGPVYAYRLSTAGEAPRVVYTSRSATQLQGNTFGNCVGYTKVTETIIDGGKTSSTVDHFYSNREIPEGVLYTRDEYGKNGLLLRSELLDDGILVQNTLYQYESIPDELRPNQRAMKYNDGIMYCYTVFPYHPRLTVKTQTSYFDDVAVTTSLSYAYSDKNYCVNQIIEKTANSKEIITRSLYSGDLNKGVYVDMNSRHIVNKPVEETRYVKEDGVEKVISSQLTLYNDMAFPAAVYSLEIDSPLSNFTAFNTTTGESRDVHYSVSPELQISYYNRIEVVLPSETIDWKGVHKVYIWSYNYSSLVATIENATRNEVEKVFPDIEMICDGDLTDDYIKQLKKLPAALPGARVTLYVYDNLIGLKQCVSPDETSVSYEYDECNRLKKIKDHSGNVLTQYQYGYKQ